MRKSKETKFWKKENSKFTEWDILPMPSDKVYKQQLFAIFRTRGLS